MTQDRSNHLAQFTDEQLAYHESGHAVMINLEGGSVARLSIDRGDARRGTHPVPQEAGSAGGGAKQELREEIAICLGGEAAMAIRGDPAPLVEAGGRSDRAAALRAAARRGVDEAAALAMIDAEESRVRERLRAPDAWKKVDALAAALTREKVLHADQIATILRGT